MTDSLEENVCRVVGHLWPEVVSGTEERPRCSRCNQDYILWIAEGLGAKRIRIMEQAILKELDNE